MRRHTWCNRAAKGGYAAHMVDDMHSTCVQKQICKHFQTQVYARNGYKFVLANFRKKSIVNKRIFHVFHVTMLSKVAKESIQLTIRILIFSTSVSIRTKKMLKYIYIDYKVCGKTFVYFGLYQIMKVYKSFSAHFMWGSYVKIFVALKIVQKCRV